MREYEPVHGIDYLNDHYAILGLSRDADIALITRAGRALLAQHHPDQFHRAAPGLKADAERRFTLIDLAYKTLSNPDRRAAYDRKLSEFPEKLVTKTGIPIMDLGRQRVDIDFLLSGAQWDGQKDLLSQLAAHSGYNASLFSIMQQAYRSDENPDDSLREAYRDVLHRKNAHLLILEELTWEGAGVSAQPEPEHVTAPDEYIQGRKEQIIGMRSRIEETLEKRLLGIAAGEAPKLLGAGEDSLIDREPIVHQAEERFLAYAPKIEELAKERAEVMAELLGLLKWEYFPPQQPMREQLAIVGLRDDVAVAEFYAHVTKESASLQGTGTSTRGIARGGLMPAIEPLFDEKTVILLEFDNEINHLMQIGHIINIHSANL